MTKQPKTSTTTISTMQPTEGYCADVHRRRWVMRPLALPLLLLLAISSSTAPARAHHGAAAYDLANAITLKATVTRFVWANPHALVTVTATSPDGTTEEWTAETAGPVILVRAGWTKNTLKARDEITIVGQRARNGSHTMLLQRVVLADGRELTSFIPR